MLAWCINVTSGSGWHIPVSHALAGGFATHMRSVRRLLNNRCWGLALAGLFSYFWSSHAYEAMHLQAAWVIDYSCVIVCRCWASQPGGWFFRLRRANSHLLPIFSFLQCLLYVIILPQIYPFILWSICLGCHPEGNFSEKLGRHLALVTPSFFLLLGCISLLHLTPVLNLLAFYPELLHWIFCLTVETYVS